MTYIERRLLLRNGPPWGFRLYEDIMEGLVVAKIRHLSPAYLAGMHEGDNILVLNGFDALDMSHTRAVQLIDHAAYTLEVVVGRYERQHKMETIYLDNRALRSRQTPQELTTTELQLFWEKEMPLKPARRPVMEHVTIIPTPRVVHTRSLIESRSQPVTIHIPPPPPREPTPDPLDARIIPHDPDVSSISVKQLMREFDAPPIAPELKKKHYADSTFYSDPGRYYPTIEEQIDMARKVADSLQDPVNNYSRGVNMFEKQRMRSEKHIREGPDPEPDPIEQATPEELENMVPPSPPPPPPPPAPSYPGLQPVNKPAYPIPPPPPLLPGKPKTVQEFLEKIKVFPTSQHTELDPQKCFDIASALYTSDSKGAQMFAKRHTRAKKWDTQAEAKANSQSDLQPTMVNPPLPTDQDPVKMKLIAKLPKKTPRSINTNHSPQTERKPFNLISISSNEPHPKPRTSLMEEQPIPSPMTPNSTLGEGTPLPFGEMAEILFSDPRSQKVHMTVQSTTGSTESSGWRPVKFKAATIETPSEEPGETEPTEEEGTNHWY